MCFGEEATLGGINVLSTLQTCRSLSFIQKFHVPVWHSVNTIHVQVVKYQHLKLNCRVTRDILLCACAPLILLDSPLLLQTGDSTDAYAHRGRVRPFFFWLPMMHEGLCHLDIWPKNINSASRVKFLPNSQTKGSGAATSAKADCRQKYRK